jgi:transposase
MFYSVTTKYVCGIDLHAKTLTGCIMDRDGKIVKTKVIPCQPVALLEFLDPWKKEITVGVESTYNWYWLMDTLKDHGFLCVLGHALYIKRKMSSKHKSDPVDSRGISDLLRTNQFPVAYDYPPQMRGVRDLLRRRRFFVTGRAGTFTHFQNSLHQDGCIEPLRNKLQYKSTRGSLVKLTENEDVQRILNTDLEYIGALDTIVDKLDKIIIAKARFHNEKHFDLLQTIPGCGEITALTVLYETHIISRFRTPQCYSSYCRVVRAENASAGKNLGGTSNDKIGNPYLKWAISEIGQSMLRYYPQVNEWWTKQAVLHGTVCAHGRLRHKIAVSIYLMLKNDTVFDMKKFLGIQDRKENPAHSGTETSGQTSEPSVLNEHPSGPLATRQKKVRTRKQTNTLSERASLHTTGMRKIPTKSASPLA